jgi:FtsZ-binding cell division protein ZapB
MNISLDDYNKVKSELELYKKLYFDLKISKCLDNINLKMENDSLNKKLEEKYNNCIDDKIKLKNEIESLKELLNPTKDSSKKRRVSVH